MRRMGEIVDGEYQKYSVAGGDYVREHFYGVDERLLRMVQHLDDQELWKMRLGGHDPDKVFAAYHAATNHRGQPTVILARTIKGYGLDEAGEGRNVTHQQKELNDQELMRFRDRFDIPLSDEEVIGAPLFRPAPDSARDALPHRAPTPSRRPSAHAPGRATAHRGARRRPLRGVLRGLGRPGGVDDDGLRPHARLPTARRRSGTSDRADHPRRGADLRPGGVLPRVWHLRLVGPALRPGRFRLVALLQGEQGWPDPRGGHHRGGIVLLVPRCRHLGYVVQHHLDPGLHFLFDVRPAARRRPRLGGGRREGARVPRRRHLGANDAARRGVAAPGWPQPPAGLDDAETSSPTTPPTRTRSP